MSRALRYWLEICPLTRATPPARGPCSAAAPAGSPCRSTPRRCRAGACRRRGRRSAARACAACRRARTRRGPSTAAAASRCPRSEEELRRLARAEPGRVDGPPRPVMTQRAATSHSTGTPSASSAPSMNLMSSESSRFSTVVALRERGEQKHAVRERLGAGQLDLAADAPDWRERERLLSRGRARAARRAPAAARPTRARPRAAARRAPRRAPRQSKRPKPMQCRAIALASGAIRCSSRGLLTTSSCARPVGSCRHCRARLWTRSPRSRPPDPCPP